MEGQKDVKGGEGGSGVGLVEREEGARGGKGEAAAVQKLQISVSGDFSGITSS